MATVRMVRNGKFADIFDSPETIKQAQLEGYSIVEKRSETKKNEQKSDEAFNFGGENEKKKSYK